MIIGALGDFEWHTNDFYADLPEFWVKLNALWFVTDMRSGDSGGPWS